MTDLLVGLGLLSLVAIGYAVGFVEGCEHTKAMNDIDRLARLAEASREGTGNRVDFSRSSTNNETLMVPQSLTEDLKHG